MKAQTNSFRPTLVASSGNEIRFESGLTIQMGTEMTLGGSANYFFEQDLRIESGGALTIKSGTTLKFAPGKRLKVYGKLQAFGSSIAPISLLGDSTWGGIYFAAGSEGDLTSVVVDGVQSYGGAAVYITNADVGIRENVIRNCAGACSGVQMTSNSHLFIYRSLVENNSWAGLDITLSNAYLVENNILDNNDAGVRANYYASPLFGYPSSGYFEGKNTIRGGKQGVSASNYGAAYVGVSSSLAHNNRLYDNTDYNAIASSNSSVTARYVWWGPDQVDSTRSNCQPTKIQGAVDWYPCTTAPDPGAAFKVAEEGVVTTIDENTLRELLIRGVEFRLRGNLQAALDVFRQVLQRAPRSTEAERAIIELGHLYADDARPEVLSLLETEAAARKPFGVVAQEVLMNTYFRRGDHVAGRAIAERLIRDYRATIHEKNALLSLFYANMAAKRTAQAQDALASLLPTFAGDEDVQAAVWLAEVEGLSVQGFGKSTEFVTDAHPGDAVRLDVEVYPNPVNPVASIGYRLDRESPVDLSVFDILGREVVRLVDAVQPAGRYEATFDGSALSTGVYIYRLSVGDGVQSGSLVLLK